MEAPGTHTFYNFPFCFPLSKSCLNSGTHSRTHCPLLPQTMYIYVFLFVCFCFFNFYLFIYLFMAVLGLRFCARAFSSGGKRGHSSSRCAGLSLSRPLLLRSTGSRRAGSAIVAHRPSCSVACGIVPDQGSNPCPLHQQADSQPLRHQGSPMYIFIEPTLQVQRCGLKNDLALVFFSKCPDMSLLAALISSHGNKLEGCC